MPSRHRLGLARWIAVLGAALLASGLVQAPEQADVPPVYDTQLQTPSGIYRLNAPNNGGAQEFTTDAQQIDLVTAYIVNKASHGTITASIRTDVTDPSSTLATSSATAELLGGYGHGWVEFSFPEPVPVEPGQVHYLVVQATGADGTVVWNGRRFPLPGALPSWNYDENAFGGWYRYDDTTRYSTTHLAFAVQPDDSARCAAIGSCYTATPRPPAELHWEGLIGNDLTVIGLDAAAVEGAKFVPYTTVLRLSDGQLRYLPDGTTTPVTVPADDPGALAEMAEARDWLESGSIPGRTEPERQIAARALLDMRLLLQSNGAIAAAWWRIWQYSWPRDGSFAAVALAETGHPEEALSILHFLQEVQRPDGTWEARYQLDGSPVQDGRRWQLDGNGWVAWAAWSWYHAAPPAQRTKKARALWPMVAKAADYAAGSLQENGLPELSPDYWENAVDAPTIANSAALLAGLRAAADMGAQLGRRDEALRYDAAARRLEAAVHAEFGPYGYPRTTRPDAGADSLVTAMMPPFVEEVPAVRKAVVHAEQVLTLPNGGILPGEDWRGSPFDAWTPETGMFALAAAATGRDAEADRWLGWLYAHRTTLGSFPEKVRADGQPLSVAPLAWTGAIVLLSLVALEGGLETPPDACDASPRGMLCRGSGSG